MTILLVTSKITEKLFLMNITYLLINSLFIYLQVTVFRFRKTTIMNLPWPNQSSLTSSETSRSNFL